MKYTEVNYTVSRKYKRRCGVHEEESNNDDAFIKSDNRTTALIVTKPLSPRVLVARATALMKRTEGTMGREGDMLIYGDLLVNRKAHTVSVAGKAINLSPKEYDLLLFLTKHYGKVLSREYILDTVWGYDYLGDLRTVDTHIKKHFNCFFLSVACRRIVFRAILLDVQDQRFRREYESIRGSIQTSRIQ